MFLKITSCKIKNSGNGWSRNYFDGTVVEFQMKDVIILPPLLILFIFWPKYFRKEKSVVLLLLKKKPRHVDRDFADTLKFV